MVNQYLAAANHDCIKIGALIHLKLGIFPFEEIKGKVKEWCPQKEQLVLTAGNFGLIFKFLKKNFLRKNLFQVTNVQTGKPLVGQMQLFAHDKFKGKS